MDENLDEDAKQRLQEFEEEGEDEEDGQDKAA